jgi:hypothetical protein
MNESERTWTTNGEEDLHVQILFVLNWAWLKCFNDQKKMGKKIKVRGRKKQVLQRKKLFNAQLNIFLYCLRALYNKKNCSDIKKKR